MMIEGDLEKFPIEKRIGLLRGCGIKVVN